MKCHALLLKERFSPAVPAAGFLSLSVQSFAKLKEKNIAQIAQSGKGNLRA